MDTEDKLHSIDNEQLVKSRRDYFLGFVFGVFFTLTIVLCMMASMALPDRGERSRSMSFDPGDFVTATPVYNCYCLYAPNAQVRYTPTRQLPVTPTSIPVTLPVTLTPLPVITVMPPYTRPVTGTLTQTTMLIWPEYRRVVTGEIFTEQMVLADFDGVDAIETIVAYNPVVLMPVTATVASNSACPIGGSRFDPGLIWLDCEGLDLANTGALFDLTFVCVHTGTTTIESAGTWSTFAGTENGWGFWPDTGSAAIRCE